MYKNSSQSKKFLSRSLWLLPFLSFLLGYQMLAWLYASEAIETPQVIGKSLQEALQILSNNNLNPRLISQKEEADLAPGTVITQSPSAKTKIKPNQSVYLVISCKPAQLKTPNYYTKSSESIAQSAKNNNIRTKIYPIDCNAPSQSCVGQWPAPDSELQERSMIIYTCNGSKKPVILPSFKQRSVPEVTEFLNQHQIPFSLIHQKQQYPNHS